MGLPPLAYAARLPAAPRSALEITPRVATAAVATPMAATRWVAARDDLPPRGPLAVQFLDLKGTKPRFVRAQTSTNTGSQQPRPTRQCFGPRPAKPSRQTRNSYTKRTSISPNGLAFPHQIRTRPPVFESSRCVTTRHVLLRRTTTSMQAHTRGVVAHDDLFAPHAASVRCTERAAQCCTKINGRWYRWAGREMMRVSPRDSHG